MTARTAVQRVVNLVTQDPADAADQRELERYRIERDRLADTLTAAEGAHQTLVDRREHAAQTAITAEDFDGVTALTLRSATVRRD